MKSVVLPWLATAFAQQASAHYVFNRLIVNNTISREFQYVRDVSGNAGTYNDLWLKTFPIYGPENANVTCGRGSFPVHNADTIQTATIVAGSDVGLMVSGPYYEGDVQGYIFHEGPGQVFLSKLPDGTKSLMEYDGKGDFFKIAYAGPTDKTTWSTMDTLAINFTIPAATPSGQYLLRIEHFMPSMTLGQSQWFVNCAHLDIVGGGNGSPGPMVRFPNAYAEDDPSIWFPTPNDLSLYKEPTPAVWKG
ncbi:hypothetical protein J4E86_004394 [Alternaria arbusti]|uniref:uncharacterized protein n=1 Tax=Alternaria arbusti TaxID=232088 RepID=UPI00221E701F|nr:uncharacterized protein J4E86_004394 [Alternaria arbusti]KAI4958788.1 hypothetical protein J4E86_004394 [Alternaria arbusti]